MRKLNKLGIKKVTLLDLDDATLQKMAGAFSQIQPTCPVHCGNTIATGKPVCCSVLPDPKPPAVRPFGG